MKLKTVALDIKKLMILIVFGKITEGKRFVNVDIKWQKGDILFALLMVTFARKETSNRNIH